MTSITHEVIETAYSIAMNCNHLDDPDNTCGECTTKMWKAAEAAEARAARLETENDEMQSYINEIRIALHTEKYELTIEAVRRVISERDELRAKLEQVQNWIESLNFIGIDSSKRYDYRSWIRSDQIGIKSEV